MQVLNCFEGGSVVDCLESLNKFDAIRELIKKAPVLSRHQNNHKIENAVIEREKIYTTGLGQGIAIAHGKTPCVKELCIVLGISQKGINFNSLDGKPVHLLFLIANPPEKNTEYLVALSSLVRILRDARFRKSLVNARSAAVIERKIGKAFHTIATKHPH